MRLASRSPATYTFVMFMLGLGAFNGLVLIAWRPARRLGWGVLLGSVAAKPLTFVWIWVVVLPSFDESAADPHMPQIVGAWVTPMSGRHDIIRPCPSC